jgi:type III pantothenate kinase
MILTVDIGNSQIELGLFKKENLHKSWRISTGIDRTEDEYMIFLSHFLNISDISPKDITGVSLASVVPNKTFIFEKMCEKYFNLKPQIVDHTRELGLKILYDDPTEVGADRICNAVAAYQKYKAALVVVDIGTATTFDIVSGRAEYIGGIIAPGIETTAWALYQRAAKLPKIALEIPLTVIGRNTEHSMQSGIMIGTVKLVDGLIEDIIKELGEQPKVIATGGLAKLIQKKSQYIEDYFPHLVLEGLNIIYKMNNRS